MSGFCIPHSMNNTCDFQAPERVMAMADADGHEHVYEADGHDHLDAERVAAAADGHDHRALG